MSETADEINQDLPNPWEMDIADINPVNPALFQQDKHWDFFSRLRKDDPVHFNEDSDFGRYWSITKFNHIMQVDTNHKVFSSEGGITLGPTASQIASGETMDTPMFIAMDPPKHDQQRATVSPVVQPANLAKLENTIRTRAGKILDELPRNEEFDWVDKVSIELTTQMLATLFDFPFEDRRKLTRWSDVPTAIPGQGVIDSLQQRREELLVCLNCFTELWNVKAKQPESNDLISMLVHGKETKDMQPLEFLGNLILLIVGGNDTTRNSISGGVLALNQNPLEYQKLRNDQSLIKSMVPEIIRWQTPLAYMRRTALQDINFQGKNIKEGDKVIMWYVSGNRDEEVIDDPNNFIIDRKNARHHLAFGFGIHRCMGNRMAEMQLRIVWEEILKRFRLIELSGNVERTYSSFVKGYTKMPVKVHDW